MVQLKSEKRTRREGERDSHVKWKVTSRKTDRD